MEAGRKKYRLYLPALLLAPLLMGLVEFARAVPIFSRKYQTSCSTCHYAFPQLNAFGKAFRNNGYRYPGGDENVRKEEPVSLGSEAYKKVFPNAIWPSDIPSMAPFAVQAIGEYDLGFNQPDSVTAGNFVFPSVVKVFYAGTLGETFSLFGEVSMENTGDAIDLGVPFRLEWNRRTAFNVAAGSIALDPTPNDRSLIPTLFNVSQLTSRNGWLLDGEQPGLEFWGAGNGPGGKGGWKYMTGVVNAQGGPVGRRQDVFARLTYKINGLGEIGGTQGQASTSSAFYEDNSLTLGGFVSTGRVGADLFADREDLTTWAGTLDGWYKRAILNAAVFNMKSQVNGLPDRNSLAWYAQGQYVVYPWLFGLARFEATHVDTNDGLDPQTTLIPALAAMARANIKVTLEYKRPMNDYSARKAAEEGMVAKLDFAL